MPGYHSERRWERKGYQSYEGYLEGEYDMTSKEAKEQKEKEIKEKEKKGESTVYYSK